MPLTDVKVADELKAFIQKMNKEKVEDADKAMEDFCKKIEELIFKAARNIVITIKPGVIQVQGTQTAQANIAPLTITNSIS